NADASRPRARSVGKATRAASQRGATRDPREQRDIKWFVFPAARRFHEVTAPLFLADADALATDPVVVTGDEARHAIDVKRLRAGEQILLTDGAGHVVAGVVANIERGRFTVDVTARRAVARPAPRLVVVQALAKGGRDEDAVEAMTEVGVDEVVGWTAERSVA